MKFSAIKLSSIIVIAFAVFVSVQATFANNGWRHRGCKEVRGDLNVVFAPGSATGYVRNAGFLNGPFATTFVPGTVTPTADPTSVTFTGDSTLTTHHGVIATRDVYLFDFVLTLGPAMLRIDPSASTGAFSGATGVIYINPISGGTTTGEATLGGKICFDRDR